MNIENTPQHPPLSLPFEFTPGPAKPINWKFAVRIVLAVIGLALVAFGVTVVLLASLFFMAMCPNGHCPC